MCLTDADVRVGSKEHLISKVGPGVRIMRNRLVAFVRASVILGAV